VRDHNENFLRRRIFDESAAFDKVERYPLTERQRQAIVTNEDTTLTIAGAGTGKTSTIVGKVDYLVRRGLARPSEILILAYGRRAAAELKERLAPFLGNDSAHTSTFHTLGLSIISAVEGSRPSLSSMVEDGTALKQFFRARLRLLLASPDGQYLLTSILAEHLDEPEPEISALNGGKTGDELIRAQQARGLRAINGIKLISREEVRIANWLTLNGIEWEYERTYPVATATRNRRAYKPDFYLPAHDLYIEHFGVDRAGRTAPHIDSADYQRAMAWKRSLHEQHGTRLVETYSYYQREGILRASFKTG